MIRIFKVHYPKQTALLASGEALILFLSFALSMLLCLGQDSSRFLSDGHSVYTVLTVIAATQFSMYCCDLYDRQRVRSSNETLFRLLMMLGIVSCLLAGIGYLFPNVLLEREIFVAGLLVTTVALISWRVAYTWLISKVMPQQRVYVLGDGERSLRLVEAIQTRDELGMKLVGRGSELDRSMNCEALGRHLVALARNGEVDSVVVAMQDRRARMPVRELLELRLRGVQVEDGTTVLEKLSGKIEVDELHPSWLIFSPGFRGHAGAALLHRILSITVSIVLLLLVLPVIPLIALAIVLTSRGPVLFQQIRVGRNGAAFNCYKFRTMRTDAEAATGPTWTADVDQRITSVGRWLRRTHLDELPQLWNVLRGDMNLCGPRPERPEFVASLSRQIPYYDLRHTVRPGITGWAQVNYKYGNTVEDTKEKLSYDLFYVKNLSLGLDLLILLQTIKTVLLRRGAQ